MPREKKRQKSAGKSWNLYLPVELAWVRERAEAEARAQRRSVSEAVLLILEAYFKAHPPSSPKGLVLPAWVTEKVPD